MIYLLGWSSIYFALILQVVLRYRGWLFALLVLFVLAMIAFLRGRVGTDTLNYEKMLLGFVSGYTWDGREPGFVLLGWLLAHITPSIEIAVRAVSFVFFFLLAWFVLRSDRNERDFLLLYVLPVFAYNYSMNALRAALAFCFVLLAVQALRREGKAKAIGLGAVGLTFHYSALVPLVYLGLAQRSWLRLANLAWAGMLVSMSGAVLVFAQTYFMDKVSAYTDFHRPSALSGLSILVPLALLLTGVALGRLPKEEKWKLLILACAALAFAWVVTQYTYAGLRVLDLLAYAIPFSVLMAYSQHGLRFERGTWAAMLIAGLLSVAATYNRFLAGYGEGRAPWLPYETWINSSWFGY
jgi:hypothetical protein